MDYKDFKNVQYTASNSYGIKWSFTSHNELIGIKVFAMDYSNYKNYLLNKSQIKYYTLSNGHKKHDSGVFPIPYKDTWFLIFLNDDPDQESTRFDVLRGLTHNPIYRKLFTQIPLIIFISIISLYAFSYFVLRLKKKKLPNWSSGLLIIILIASYFYATLSDQFLSYSIDFPYYPRSLSSPIDIDSSDDFERYLIPGNGTLEDPYRIENRTICTSGSYAIQIEGVTGYFIIQNNFLHGSSGAIRLYNLQSEFIQIINNTCIGTVYNTRGRGINIHNTYGNLIIKNNTLINYDTGINLGNSPQTRLENNKLLYNTVGLYVYSSNSSKILNNTFIFKQSEYWYYDSLYIRSSYNCTVKNNNFIGSGVSFSEPIYQSLICENNTVNNLKLGYFKDIDGIIINNSNIYGQLIFNNCSDIILENQNIEHTNYAVTFIDCSISSCSFSNFSNNHNIGIQIFNSNDFNISNCRFSFNDEGAYIFNSNSTNFSDNVINNNFIGISSITIIIAIKKKVYK